MTVRTRSVSTLSFDELDLDLQYSPEGEPVVEKVGDKVVVGYLVRDEDCENPLENSDGVGKLHRWYHGSRESREAFYEATGYNEHGKRVAKPHPFALWLDVYSHSGEHWSLHGGGYQCRWDTSRHAGVWEPDPCCLEHIRYEGLRRLLPEGCKVEYRSKYTPEGKCITRKPRKGEKPYFADGTVAVKKYSNDITYVLPDGTAKGGFKNFATAIRAAAKALGVTIDKELLLKKQWEVARECAQQALDSYNAWNSGDCYGVCVEVFDAEGDRISDDACWGYIGSDYAEETVRDEVQSKVKELQKTE